MAWARPRIVALDELRRVQGRERADDLGVLQVGVQGGLDGPGRGLELGRDPAVESIPRQRMMSLLWRSPPIIQSSTATNSFFMEL